MEKLERGKDRVHGKTRIFSKEFEFGDLHIKFRHPVTLNGVEIKHLDKE